MKNVHSKSAQRGRSLFRSHTAVAALSLVGGGLLVAMGCGALPEERETDHPGASPQAIKAGDGLAVSDEVDEVAEVSEEEAEAIAEGTCDPKMANAATAVTNCPGGMIGATCKCYEDCYKKKHGKIPDPVKDKLDGGCGTCCIGMAPIIAPVCACAIIDDVAKNACKAAAKETCKVVCNNLEPEEKAVCLAGCNSALSKLCGGNNCDIAEAECSAACENLPNAALKAACKASCKVAKTFCGGSINPAGIACDTAIGLSGDACILFGAGWDPTNGLGSGSHCWSDLNNCNVCCQQHCGVNIPCKAACLNGCALASDSSASAAN